MTSPMNRQCQPLLSIIATMLVEFAGLAKTGGTAAAEPSTTLSKTVTHSDLNLDSREGAKALASAVAQVNKPEVIALHNPSVDHSDHNGHA